MHDDDSALTRLVAEADPARGAREELDRVTFIRAWDEIEREALAATPGRRRTRTALVAAAAAVAVGGAGAAAVQVIDPVSSTTRAASSTDGPQPGDPDFIPTRTGEMAPADPPGGPGEELRSYGSDFPKVLRELGADIPFPDEASRELAYQIPLRDHRNAVEAYDPDDPMSRNGTTTGTLRGTIADLAICAWVNEWAVGIKEGDQAQVESARAALESATMWDAVTALDADPSPVGRRGDDDRMHPTRFGHLVVLQRIAQGSDIEEMYAAADDTGKIFPIMTPALPWDEETRRVIEDTDTALMSEGNG